jgi:hypothetical protein
MEANIKFVLKMAWFGPVRRDQKRGGSKFSTSLLSLGSGSESFQAFFLCASLVTSFQDAFLRVNQGSSQDQQLHHQKDLFLIDAYP